MFRKFRKDTRGSLAVPFALSLVPLVVAIGCSLDYSRYSHARTTLQTIADASALAANRYTLSTAQQVQSAVDTFARAQLATSSSFLQDLTTTSSISADKRTITVTLSARVKSTVTQLIGQTFWSLSASSETIRGQDSQLELALVLDNTGSMGDPASNGQTKIANLITQSKKLIDTLTSDPQASVKIGLVPFTQYVNVGTANRSASWMNVPADYSTSTNCDKKGKNCTITNYIWSGCATSRVGYNTVDTTSPAYPGLMIVQGSTSPCPVIPVQPLSTNFTNLKTQIGNMKASGSTYVPGGLTWGWNVLSSSVPYTEAAAYDPNNRKPRKAVVLMTDGENTVSMSADGTHNGTSQTTADTASSALCTNMKAQKIEVFVVAFMVTNTAAKTMLSKCATDATYYFDAADATAFQAAWDKIAYSLRTPYLAK